MIVPNVTLTAFEFEQNLVCTTYKSVAVCFTGLIMAVYPVLTVANTGTNTWDLWTIISFSFPRETFVFYLRSYWKFTGARPSLHSKTTGDRTIRPGSPNRIRPGSWTAKTRFPFNRCPMTRSSMLGRGVVTLPDTRAAIHTAFTPH